MSKDVANKYEYDDEGCAVKRPDSAVGRNAIFELEAHMDHCDPAENGVIHTHRFAPGVYTREMFVPAGLMITGMIHKTEHISIFLSGKMLIANGDGSSTTIEAPIVETALPGVKRAGIALEDVRWITIHPTEETDTDVIERLLVTNDFSEVEHLVDQRDYEDFALEFNVTEETKEEFGKFGVRKQPIDGVEILPSKRDGLGVFAKREIKAGEIIAPAIIGGELMEYSRYANHSMNPNAQMVPFHDGVNIVAIRDISNEEVTVDYRDSFNKRISA